MRALQITLFVIGLLAITTQSFRHAYVKWIEPRTSALDRFQEPVEKEITDAKSLEELVTGYEEAHKKADEDRKLHEKDPPGEARERWSDREQREPYVSERKLEQAIRTWEEHHTEIYRLRFFWACGAVSLVLGLIAYRLVDRWLGMVGIIGGFLEMIWWSSPSFRAMGAQVEFDKLLTEKLAFSLIAWALLVALWFIAGPRRNAS
jgi:hypothetical protein